MLTFVRRALVPVIALVFTVGSNSETLGQATTSKSYLELNFEQFDQDMDGGWRVNAKAKKYPDAAKMIEEYLSERRGLKPEHRRMLHFHAGQMWAMAEQEKNAIPHLKKSTQPRENDFMRWNAYVEGTVAFLEKDNAKLVAARDEVSKAGIPVSVNKNLVVLDLLIQSPNSSYRKIFEELIEKSEKQAQGKSRTK